MHNQLYRRELGGNAITVALKVTVTLNVHFTGSFQGSTGDICGISQSVAHQYIKEVTNALFRWTGDYVCFRTDPDSQAERTIGFGAIAGFPQVQGVINCMHVAIKVPEHQPAAFPTGRASTPTMCNHCKQIMHDCACFLRDRHNAYGWILGDKGYPLRTRLLMPVRNPRVDAEERYNACHWTMRATIEQAFGLLKMRFRCLDQSREAHQYALASPSRIVVVCCVLHIHALQRGESMSMRKVMSGMPPQTMRMWSGKMLRLAR
ncbi:putative nuclease HARBI1 [Heterodontus francisci]|uniref:putative nuclease HARBI1 n=1 Tax=Heterodontus francisci TaxID=7792 RepID=UPI00355BE326